MNTVVAQDDKVVVLIEVETDLAVSVVKLLMESKILETGVLEERSVPFLY